MLRRSLGNRREVSIPIRIDESVPSREQQQLVHFKIDAGPEQQLLPSVETIMAAPLAFQVNAPPASADRMVTEVHSPAVQVVINGLSTDRNHAEQKD
jgi:hypothetical protein